MTDQVPITTGTVFRQHRWRLALTYTLTLLEQVFELLYPFMIGIAIDGLLNGEFVSLVPLVLTWTLHSLMAVLRQLYDTRIFSRIYQDFAATVIVAQQKQGVATSHLAARSELMREFVDFLEEEIPFVITVFVSFAGAFLLLTLFDWIVGGYALLILLPLFGVNALHRRTTHHLNRSLNDQLEQEVEIIETRQPEQIKGHFGQLARWYIRLSDADARTWLTMQPFLLGLIVLALVRSTHMNMEPGDIFAIIAYALSFVDSLDEVPLIVQQYSRLQDITERVNSNEIAEE